MKTVSALSLFALAAYSPAETTYLGLYLQGTKIGYSSFSTSDTKVDGKLLKRSDTRTEMSLGLLGQPMTIRLDSTTWNTSNGKPTRLKFRMSSAGRVQTVDAVFGATSITASIQNADQKSTKTLQIPKGGDVVDDPMAAFTAGRIVPGKTSTVYVLDPMTVDLIKNEVKVVGKRSFNLDGKTLSGTQIDIIDPRASTKVFVSAKGDLLMAEGAMGIMMRPITREVALGKANPYAPSVDLAVVSSVKLDKPIPDPDALRGMKIRVTGRDLARVPSGEHQTVSQADGAWVIDVHPVRLADLPPSTLADAGKAQMEWLQPGMNIPSNAPKFRNLARTIIGNTTDARTAAKAIRRYVRQIMRPNAGIGVLRDATEVLTSREGVCRDYAVLTATLLRSAGLPARLASGLVFQDGTFYYHAWAEAFISGRWVGLDSTRDVDQISPTHVKLGEGTVESAFAFTFLDRVKLELLEARKD